MNQRLINWQQNLDSQALEEYNSLRRSLQRNRGFGLFFVQCSPATGTNIIAEIKQDIPQKKIATLKFDQPIDSLYNEIIELPNINNTDILFISGLEHSLLAYEEYTFGNSPKGLAPGGASDRETYANSKERYSQSKRGIPRFLGYLNLQRDRFKRDFPLSLVFLVPIFGIQYLIKRAPDFFDWRSGFFRFMPQKESAIDISFERIIQQDLNQSRSELLDTKILAKTLELNSDEQLQILYKQSLLALKCDHNEEAIATLDKIIELNPNDDLAWFYRGNALGELERNEEAIASYDKSLAINPNQDLAWFNRGIALEELERNEEAIASYDKSLAINPNNDLAWLYRGTDLGRLERYEEALASYDKSLAINPYDDLAWFYRGIALEELERYEEAVASYDKGLAIDSNDYFVWFYRGATLGELEKYEEAVVSYDKGLEINSNDDTAWFNRGIALEELERYEEAVASYDKCLEINPNQDSAWFNRGFVLGKLERYEEAVASYDKCLAINPNQDSAWFNRGNDLGNLERYEEAVASYDKCLAINPNQDSAWFNRACYLALLNRVEPAIASLNKAISLNKKNKEMAKTDSDFDNIRHDQRFQFLVNSPV